MIKIRKQTFSFVSSFIWSGCHQYDMLHLRKDNIKFAGLYFLAIYLQNKFNLCTMTFVSSLIWNSCRHYQRDRKWLLLYIYIYRNQNGHHNITTSALQYLRHHDIDLGPRREPYISVDHIQQVRITGRLSNFLMILYLLLNIKCTLYTILLLSSMTFLQLLSRKD